MKPIKYKKHSKAVIPNPRNACGVYLVSNRNERGEITYSFVSLNPQGRWLLSNIDSSNLDHISSLGIVVGSYRGKDPIQSLKQQLVESGA